MKCSNAILLSVFVLAGAMGQNFACAQSAAITGAAVAGVHLTIALTNNVLSAGSTNIVHCVFKNSSTNDIHLERTGYLEVDCSAISLIDPSGKIYDLRPHIPFKINFSSGFITIPSGEMYECDIQIQIPNEAKTGKYKLNAIWRFTIANNGKFTEKEVVSNLLKIEIK